MTADSSRGAASPWDERVRFFTPRVNPLNGGADSATVCFRSGSSRGTACKDIESPFRLIAHRVMK